MIALQNTASSTSDLAALQRQVESIEHAGDRLTIEAGGTKVVWHRWGQGPNVLLVHGAYGAWTHWIRNIAELARHYSVWIPDVPSFGQSGTIDPGDHDVIRAAEILNAGFSQIAPPDQPVAIVGFSFGGRIAAELSILLGDRASTIVLVAPGGFAERAVHTRLPKRWRNAGSAEEIWNIQRYNLEVIMFADPTQIDEMAIYLHVTNAAAARARPSRPDPAVLLGILGQVRSPMRAIWGDRDSYHLGLLEKRLDILRTFDPALRSHIIPDGGHWVMYEKPEAFNGALLELLAP